MRKYCIVVLTVLACLNVGQAEEPIQAFLTALQEQGHYSVALGYLDRMESSKLAPSSFQSEADYHRGMVLIQSARAMDSSQHRKRALNDAERVLRKFVDAHPNHTLSALARSQLGNVMVERARTLTKTAQAQQGPAKRATLKEAAAIYQQAHEVLSASRTEIGKQYKSLVGRRDRESRSKLDSVKGEYVKTYLAMARVLYEHAETLPEKGEPRRKKLTEAATAFEEVAQKYRKFSAGIYALLYEGKCYQQLGETKRALTYFKELLQNPDKSLGVRQLKTEALAHSIACWLDSDPKAGPKRSIESGEAWLLQNRENNAASGELRLMLAKAYHARSGQDDGAAAKRNLDKARSLASELARRAGPTQKRAQTLLVTLGRGPQTNPSEQDEAEPKDFAAARDAAKAALDAMKLAKTTQTLLSNQLPRTTNATRRATMEEKISQAEQDAQLHTDKALRLFRLASQLATDDDAQALNSVRYYLAYLYYSQAQYAQAAVLAQFVAMRYPDSLAARECASVALAARQRLYQEAAEKDKAEQAERIAQIAELMVAKWPQESQADVALSTLLDLTLQRGDWDKAEAFLNQIPADSPRRAQAELRTGQALWRQYLTAVAQATEEAPNAAQGAAKLKQQAERMLAGGLDRLGNASPNESIVRAGLSLAQIYVEDGKPAAALDVLQRRRVGPLSLVEADSPWVQKIPGLATESYKNAILANVASAAAANDSAAAIQQAQDLLGQFKQQLAKEANSGLTPKQAQQRLIAIYVSLARDLQRQLAVADADSRAALSQGFESFLSAAGEDTTDATVLNWVGETFLNLGNQLQQGNATTPAAQRYYRRAADALAKALDHSDGVSETQLIQTRVRQAMALRQLGKYDQALDLLAAVLKQRNKALNIQVEAAKTLQRQGAQNNEAYWQAIRGSHPDSSGRNLIWGWGRIAKLISKSEQYRDTFHLARYNLALCRYKYAMKKPAEKTKHLGRAQADILFTKNLVGLGNAAQQKRYQSLLNAIAKELRE